MDLDGRRTSARSQNGGLFLPDRETEPKKGKDLNPLLIVIQSKVVVQSNSTCNFNLPCCAVATVPDEFPPMVWTQHKALPIKNFPPNGFALQPCPKKLTRKRNAADLEKFP